MGDVDLVEILAVLDVLQPILPEGFALRIRLSRRHMASANLNHLFADRQRMHAPEVRHRSP